MQGETVAVTGLGDILAGRCAENDDGLEPIRSTIWTTDPSNSWRWPR